MRRSISHVEFLSYETEMELESGNNSGEPGCPMAINLKELVQDDDAGIQMASECPLTGEKVKRWQV